MAKHKYSAVRTEVDGIKFASKKEAGRYLILKMMEKQGHVSNLRLQVPFELNKGGTFSFKYVCDFVYEQNGQTIHEDSKGAITAVFKKKQKLMKKVYGIDIKIT